MNHKLITVRASDGSVIKLECHNALPSTSRLAKIYAKNGYPDRYVVFAEGQKKRDEDGKFRGSVDRGIYMSCILRPSIFPSQASLISSLAAVSLATALEEHITKKIGIGWVSKIYCDGKIIGNASIEGKLDNFTSYEYIIVTFSVTLNDDDFSPRLTDLIKKVFETESSSIPIIIAKNILNKFFAYYSNLKNHSKFMNIYRQKFLLRGEKIRYINNGKKERCKVLGIDENNGSLMVENSRKQVVYISTPNKVSIPKKIKIK